MQLLQCIFSNATLESINSEPKKSSKICKFRRRSSGFRLQGDWCWGCMGHTLEKLIDFWEVTSITWVTLNYLELKNIVKWRKEKYIWESVLSKNNNNLICENLLKINLTSLKFNENCIHICLFLVLYTSYMRTMMQIKKFNTQLVSAYLRLIADFSYFSETFWDIKSLG